MPIIRGQIYTITNAIGVLYVNGKHPIFSKISNR
jgi:hypothetical protein